jgi:hypothetical protein
MGESLNAGQKVVPAQRAEDREDFCTASSHPDGPVEGGTSDSVGPVTLLDGEEQS